MGTLIMGGVIRHDSWTFPGSNTIEILRTVSLESEVKASAREFEDKDLCGKSSDTTATAQAVQIGVVNTESDICKAISPVEAKCTPCTSLVELIQQLDEPSLPNIRLPDLSSTAKEELVFLTHRNFGAEIKSRGGILYPVEELANFPSLLANKVDPDVEKRKCTVFPPNRAVKRPFLFLKPAYRTYSSDDKYLGIQQNLQDARPSQYVLLHRPRKRTRVSEPDSACDEGSGSCTGIEVKKLSCRSCGTQQTPQWRMGPEGPRTLCNACGVKYKKTQKRANNCRRKYTYLPDP